MQEVQEGQEEGRRWEGEAERGGGLPSEEKQKRANGAAGGGRNRTRSRKWEEEKQERSIQAGACQIANGAGVGGVGGGGVERILAREKKKDEGET